MGWTYIIVATLDVCVNETTPTILCDDEGYDIIPIEMIKAAHEPIENQEDEHHKRVSKMQVTPEERKGLETNIKWLDLEDKASSITWSKEEKLDRLRTYI